jgi:hypothetical protein
VKHRQSKKAKTSFVDRQAESLKALDSYHHVLSRLTESGISQKKKSSARPTLPYVHQVEGLENLYRSLSSVAPARPAAVDEEWNPLSQRPHSPLPPVVGKELGAEITALKEAIDAFTTLSHEMMHVALWEPFFTGKWRPLSRAQFRNFSLMAEGYCFFFGDIIVTSLVRKRYADGEFAFARQTPSNALFHPMRAFDALGISDKNEILDIYLDGFVGKKTSLATSRHASNFASSLAGRIYEFYSGTLGYLNHMHEVFLEIGVLDEFYERFCTVPGLPTFLEDSDAGLAKGPDFKPYFETFFRRGQKSLGQLSEVEITSIRWRRMLQSRAYYALQVRWYLSEERLIAKRWSAALSQRVLKHVDSYLSAIEALLIELGQSPGKSPVAQLAALDLSYDQDVRRIFIDHEAWVGHRWLIVPKRAGGLISVFENTDVEGKNVKIKLLRIVAFILDELTREMKSSQTIERRTEVLAEIEQVAAIGAACSTESAKVLKGMEKKLNHTLLRPIVRQAWSLPLAAFNPGQNLYRELAFSYQ